MEATPTWNLPGAVKRKAGITADWQFVDRPLIDGVVLKEIRNVPTGDGYLTEVWRNDWRLDGAGVDQVFQAVLEPGRVSAWHAHETTLDRLYVSRGMLRVVLYDGRPGSPTRGMLNEFLLGTVRPGLVTVPPQVWHGIQNVAHEPTSILNLVDMAYRYQDPDHWAVPWDSDLVPYRWPQWPEGR